MGTKEIKKTFTREDIQAGYVVRLRKGETRIVLPAGRNGTLIAVNRDHEWDYVSHWTSDLRARVYVLDGLSPRLEDSKVVSEYDIVAVYGFVTNPNDYGDTTRVSKHNRPVLWERVDPKKMTVSEIAEALGYPVEIVEG